MPIRAASPKDAETLTGIAFAAKRHWGYPEAWIERWRDLLTVTPEFIDNSATFAAIQDRRTLGFHSVTRKALKLDLLHMWVLPDAMGRGVGRSLFVHCLTVMRQLGCSELEIESDPNAEGFYQRLGAERIGTRITELDGQIRELPILVVRSQS